MREGRTKDRTDADAGLAEARTRLDRAQGELMEAAARIHKCDGFGDQELNDLKLLLKEGKRVQSSTPTVITDLARRYEEQAEEFSQRAEAMAAESPEPQPRDATVPTTDRKALVLSPTGSVRGDLPAATAQAGTTLYPNAAPVDGTTWGEKAATTLQPVYRAVVGHVKPSKTEEDAHVRATLLAPVLTGALSPADAAEAWKKKFRDGVQSPEDALALRDIPESYQRKYRKLSAKTLRRWRSDVEVAEVEAEREGRSRPPVWKSLLHTYPVGTDHPHRVCTPELVKKATDLFLENKDWSAARVADYLKEEAGYEGSERSIQRIIQEEISEVDRALARGGSAADNVIFGSYLPRETPYPNHTWIIDHSFIQQEIVDLDYLDVVKEEVDFEFHCAVARPTPSGYVELRRTTGLWITLIIDACTRRILCLRVWDHHPNTATTLLALREAMMQFGVPEILYSDNGSDFKSGDTMRALQAAGVRQIFSLPYRPEGRGKVERFFGTIKERVLPGLEGYHGGRHRREWATDELLTLAEVERNIWNYVDRVFNHEKVHKTTKVTSARHYDERVGAARMRGLGDESFIGLLLVAKDVTKRNTGFVIEGRAYWSGMLSQIPNGSHLYVHYDPYRPETVYVTVPAAGGTLEFLCVAEEYGGPNGTPTPIEVHRLEAEARRQIAEVRQEREAGRRKQRRLKAGREKGEALGVPLAEEVMADHLALKTPLSHAALPPAGGSSGPPAEDDDGQATHTEVSEAETHSAREAPTKSKRDRSREHRDGDVVVTLFDL